MLAAACSTVRPAGLGTTRSAAAHAYSANAPRKKPSTWSPLRIPAFLVLGGTAALVYQVLDGTEARGDEVARARPG